MGLKYRFIHYYYESKNVHKYFKKFEKNDDFSDHALNLDWYKCTCPPSS